MVPPVSSWSTVTLAGRSPVLWLAATPPATWLIESEITPTFTPAPVVPMARACGPWWAASPWERVPPVSVPSAASMPGCTVVTALVAVSAVASSSLVGGQPAGDQPLRSPVVGRGDPHAQPVQCRRGVGHGSVDVDVDQHVAVVDPRPGEHLHTVACVDPGLLVDRPAAGRGLGEDLEPAVELGDVGTRRVRGAGGRGRLEAEREESGAEQGNGNEATSLHRATVSRRTAKAPWPTWVRRRVLPRRSRRHPGRGTPCAARRRSPSAARRPSRSPRRRRR